MNPIEKKVVIYVKKTPDHKPYANVFYQNGTELQNPASLDYPTQVFANYIAKKTVTNEIHGTIYSFSEKKMVDRFDISPLTDKDYCIAGSNVGRKYTVQVIQKLTDAASSKEVMAPVYLTDCTNEVLMNDELFRRNRDMDPISTEELNHKYELIEEMISEEKDKNKKLEYYAA